MEILNKIQIDDIRYRAEKGTATSQDCLDLLGHMDEFSRCGLAVDQVLEIISDDIGELVNVEIDYIVELNKTRVKKYLPKKQKGLIK